MEKKECATSRTKSNFPKSNIPNNTVKTRFIQKNGGKNIKKKFNNAYIKDIDIGYSSSKSKNSIDKKIKKSAYISRIKYEFSRKQSLVEKNNNKKRLVSADIRSKVRINENQFNSIHSVSNIFYKNDMHKHNFDSNLIMDNLIDLGKNKNSHLYALSNNRSISNSSKENENENENEKIVKNEIEKFRQIDFLKITNYKNEGFIKNDDEIIFREDKFDIITNESNLDKNKNELKSENIKEKICNKNSKEKKLNITNENMDYDSNNKNYSFEFNKYGNNLHSNKFSNLCDNSFDNKIKSDSNSNSNSANNGIEVRNNCEKISGNATEIINNEFNFNSTYNNEKNSFEIIDKNDNIYNNDDRFQLKEKDDCTEIQFSIIENFEKNKNTIYNSNISISEINEIKDQSSLTKYNFLDETINNKYKSTINTNFKDLTQHKETSRINKYMDSNIIKNSEINNTIFQKDYSKINSESVLMQMENSSRLNKKNKTYYDNQCINNNNLQIINNDKRNIIDEEIDIISNTFDKYDLDYHSHSNLINKQKYKQELKLLPKSKLFDVNLNDKDFENRNTLKLSYINKDNTLKQPLTLVNFYKQRPIDSLEVIKNSKSNSPELSNNNTSNANNNNNNNSLNLNNRKSKIDHNPNFNKINLQAVSEINEYNDKDNKLNDKNLMNVNNNDYSDRIPIKNKIIVEKKKDKLKGKSIINSKNDDSLIESNFQNFSKQNLAFMINNCVSSRLGYNKYDDKNSSSIYNDSNVEKNILKQSSKLKPIKCNIEIDSKLTNKNLNDEIFIDDSLSKKINAKGKLPSIKSNPLIISNTEPNAKNITKNNKIFFDEIPTDQYHNNINNNNPNINNNNSSNINNTNLTNNHCTTIINNNFIMNDSNNFSNNIKTIMNNEQNNSSFKINPCVSSSSNNNKSNSIKTDDKSKSKSSSSNNYVNVINPLLSSSMKSYNNINSNNQIINNTNDGFENCVGVDNNSIYTLQSLENVNLDNNMFFITNNTSNKRNFNENLVDNNKTYQTYQTFQTNSNDNNVNSVLYKTIKTNGLDPYLFGEYGSLIRWKALSILNETKFSSVYKAFNLDDGTIFVAKKYNTINQNISTNNNSNTIYVSNLILIKNEINFFKQLNHQNIIKYIGSETFDGNFFVYLEYVSGGSLKNLINKIGRLNEKLIRKYLIQILDGLEYLHKMKIVHRDLKCSNILLTSEGNIKIIDFGVSTQILASQSMMDNQLLSSLKGTIPWMAPEVINQSKYCKKIDVWSLGCTLIEMCSGKTPWSDINQDNYIQALLKIGNSQDIPNIPNDISSNLKSFLLQCLVRDPKQRKKISDLKKSEFLTSVS